MPEDPRSRSHGSKHLPDLLEALKGVEGPVLDFGCGEGIFAEASPQYLGLDLNPDAARRVLALGKPALAGDLHRAPIRTRSCGAVLCMNVLHGLADPERVLLEIDRVLSPGGRVYLKNRWHKGGGRPATAGGRLANVLHLHRFRYWNHAWQHPAGRLFLSPNPDGTRGICPSCVRRWFEARGYDVLAPWSQVLVGMKRP